MPPDTRPGRVRIPIRGWNLLVARRARAPPPAHAAVTEAPVFGPQPPAASAAASVQAKIPCAAHYRETTASAV